MAVILISGSNVSLTTGTETILTNVGVQGRYQLYADLSNYQQGDALTLRVKLMATPTGTARVIEAMSYYGLQPVDDIVKFSSPIANDQTDGTALQFTAQQTQGVSRALLWKVLQLDKEPANFISLGIDNTGDIIGVNNVGNVTGSIFTNVIASPQTFNLSGTVGALATNLDKVNYQLAPNQVVIASALQALVGVTGGIVDAVRGGFVTVSGTVNLTNNQVVNFSGTITNVFNVLNPVVADVRSLVGVSGTVVVGTNNDKTNYFLGTPQRYDWIGNQTGSIQGNIINVVTGTAPIDYSQIWSFTGSRTVDAVKGGLVTVSGAVIADVRSLVGISGTVVVGQNLDKSGYSLSNPQTFNLIGNISGTITNVYNVISGTQVSLDPASIWSFTGSRSLNGLQIWNWIGNQTGSIVGNITTVITGSAAAIDYSQVWSYTGTRSLNGQQYWNLSGSISPGQAINLNVTGVAVDVASVWSYPTRTLTDQVFNLPPVEQGNNLNIRRGDTFIWAPTNLGSLANLSKLYFTIKRLYTDLDTESEVQVEKTGGLLYVNRQPATVPLNGSIVVNDANLGNITITIAAIETAKLDLLMDIFYDVQFINASGTVSTLVAGLVTIEGDATRGTTP